MRYFDALPVEKVYFTMHTIRLRMILILTPFGCLVTVS